MCWWPQGPRSARPLKDGLIWGVWTTHRFISSLGRVTDFRFWFPQCLIQEIPDRTCVVCVRGRLSVSLSVFLPFFLLLPNTMIITILFILLLLLSLPISLSLSYLCLYLSPSLPSSTSKELLFSWSVMSDSLWPHGLQHTRLPRPSPSPRVCADLCPLSPWYHPTISSSVVPCYYRHT